MPDDVARRPAWHSAADILGGLLARLPHAGRLQEYRVWEVWEEVVGGEIARQARPVRIQDGKLFVTVSHPACAQELQFAKARVRARLNQKLGGAAVKGIFLIVGGAGPAAAPPAPRRPLPPFTELAVPALGNPQIEGALAAVLAARRRRLAEETPHDADDARERG
ncbi:MAG: DUF721 domain-containing protein [Thermodesulfobacteriota bacterium]|jgi:hypothetical protein